jgi:hypothetical protein
MSASYTQQKKIQEDTAVPITTQGFQENKNRSLLITGTSNMSLLIERA